MLGGERLLAALGRVVAEESIRRAAVQPTPTVLRNTETPDRIPGNEHVWKTSASRQPACCNRGSVRWTWFTWEEGHLISIDHTNRCLKLRHFWALLVVIFIIARNHWPDAPLVLK